MKKRISEENTMQTFQAPYEIPYHILEEVRKAHETSRKSQTYTMELKDGAMNMELVTLDRLTVNKQEIPVFYFYHYDEKTSEFTEGLTFGADIFIRAVSWVDKTNYALYTKELMPILGVVCYGSLPVENENSRKYAGEMVIKAIQYSNDFQFITTNSFIYLKKPEITYSCRHLCGSNFYYIHVNRYNAKLIRELKPKDLENVQLKVKCSKDAANEMERVLKAKRLDMLFM